MSAPAGLSARDIGVMREIVRWRKANGVQRYETPGVRGSVTYSVPTRYGPDGRKVGPVLEWDHRPGGIITISRGGGRFHDFASVPAASFTEAVDLLVTYGFLPLPFSSAYRAGWYASKVWHGREDECAPGEHDRLFGDPRNISFPAGAE